MNVQTGMQFVKIYYLYPEVKCYCLIAKHAQNTQLQVEFEGAYKLNTEEDIEPKVQAVVAK